MVVILDGRSEHAENCEIIRFKKKYIKIEAAVDVN